jgi:hypothetical protein
MGKINAVLLLSLLYGLLLTPLAIGLRLAGRDVLRRKKGAAGGSYWEEAENAGEGGDTGRAGNGGEADPFHLQRQY